MIPVNQMGSHSAVSLDVLVVNSSRLQAVPLDLDCFHHNSFLGVLLRDSTQ